MSCVCSNCQKPLVEMRRRKCRDCGADLCQKCGISIVGKPEVLCSTCASMAHCSLCGASTRHRTGGRYLCPECRDKGTLWAARQAHAQQG